MIIVGCSKGEHIAEKIAKELKTSYSQLDVKKFPDGEINIKFNKKISGSTVVLVQSFYGNISDCIIEVLFASDTAKELGAKKIILVAPYFPYLRQDKRFHSGECISLNVMTKLIGKYFNKILIVDPHLHRQKKLSDIFSINSNTITSNSYIADYIKKYIKNPLIVGPDYESYKWVKNIAKKINCEFVTLNKKRYSGREVKTTLNKKININNKNIVFVDDIISTGNTILEAVKTLKKIGAKKFNCIAVHGIFVENALNKLKKANVKVITTNSIPNKVDKIDISSSISEALKK